MTRKRCLRTDLLRTGRCRIIGERKEPCDHGMRVVTCQNTNHPNMATSGVNRWLHESLGSECCQCLWYRHVVNQPLPNLHYQRSANQQSFAGLPTPPDHERCFIVFPFFEAKDLTCGKIFGVTKAIFHLIVPTLEVLLYYLIIILNLKWKTFTEETEIMI